MYKMYPPDKEQAIRKVFQLVEIRKRTSESIRLVLKKAIVTNLLEPMAKLDEDYLSDLLDVSRTTVREALLLLEKEDYLFYDPRSGFRVREPSLGEIIEVNEYLYLLSKAALETLRPHDKFAEILIRESLKKDASNPLSGLAMDRRFHLTVAMAGGNDTLLNAMTDGYDRLFWGMKCLGLPDFSEELTKDREEIAEMIVGEETAQNLNDKLKNHFYLRMNLILGEGLCPEF